MRKNATGSCHGTGQNILVGGGQGQESGRVGSEGGAGPTSQPQDLCDSQALLPSPATFHV